MKILKPFLRQKKHILPSNHPFNYSQLDIMAPSPQERLFIIWNHEGNISIYIYTKTSHTVVDVLQNECVPNMCRRLMSNQQVRNKDPTRSQGSELLLLTKKIFTKNYYYYYLLSFI